MSAGTKAVARPHADFNVEFPGCGYYYCYVIIIVVILFLLLSFESLFYFNQRVLFWISEGRRFLPNGTFLKEIERQPNWIRHEAFYA